MRILPVNNINCQYKVYNKQTNTIKEVSVIEQDVNSVSQDVNIASLSFKSLFSYLKMKPKKFLNEKEVDKIVKKVLMNLNYEETQFGRISMFVKYMTNKAGTLKYYKNMVEKILELAQNDINVCDIWNFEKVSFEPDEFEKIANKLLRIKDLGYSTKYLRMLYQAKINDEKDIQTLVNIRNEGLSKKEQLAYPFWAPEDDDIDELFFSEPELTLNTIKCIGYKSLVNLFSEKYDNVEKHINCIGNIGQDSDMFENLIQLINPFESNLFKQNQIIINELKAEFKHNSNTEDLKKTINNYTKRNRTLVENSIKDPKDKVLVAYIFNLLDDSPLKLKFLLPLLKENSKFGKKKIEKELNKTFLTDNQGRTNKQIDFRKTNHIMDLCIADEFFWDGFNELLIMFNDSNLSSIKSILCSTEANKKTRKLFNKNHINFDNWIAFNPNSKIKKDIILNSSSLKQSALDNMEHDFNDVLFESIPPNEFENLKSVIAQQGYTLEPRQEAEYDANGFLVNTKQVVKILKNGKLITFDDLKELMNLLKKEMRSSDFWNTKNSDEKIEFAKNIIRNNLLVLRNNEIKNANTIDSKEIMHIEVSKADMSNLEHSLFLGNDADCCAAVGSGANQWTAPNYIQCQLISCIEVKDGDRYIGNTMCYFAKIDNKPALILDNIELQKKYQFNNEIRDAIFEYARKLTAEVGQPDISIYASPNRHKVNMNGFDIVNKDFNIIGTTNTCEIYLDFDAEAHQIDENSILNSDFYKIDI